MIGPKVGRPHRIYSTCRRFTSSHQSSFLFHKPFLSGKHRTHHELHARQPVVAPSAPDAGTDDSRRPAIGRGPLHRAQDRRVGLGHDRFVWHCGRPADIQQSQETYAALVGRLHRDCCLGMEIPPLSSNTSRSRLIINLRADSVPHFYHRDCV